MRAALTPAGRRVLDLYQRESRGTRLHTAVRWRTCPFEAVAEAVPVEGRVLELGCGHGLFAALVAERGRGRATVHGTDVDGDKIRAAERMAAASQLSLTFAASVPGEIPAGPWDAIAIVDVLYLIDRPGQEALLRAAAAHLAPGGVLVVKEMNVEPRWKFRWMRLQEQMAVKVLRITEGDRLTFVPPDAVAGWLLDAGLTVGQRPLDRGYIHPHHLLVGTRDP